MSRFDFPGTDAHVKMRSEGDVSQRKLIKFAPTSLLGTGIEINDY